jgi:hypothetical protein
MSDTQEIQSAEDICDKLFGRESVADLAKRVILADIIAARDAAIRADEDRKWKEKICEWGINHNHPWIMGEI